MNGNEQDPLCRDDVELDKVNGDKYNTTEVGFANKYIQSVCLVLIADERYTLTRI